MADKNLIKVGKNRSYFFSIFQTNILSPLICSLKNTSSAGNKIIINIRELKLKIEFGIKCRSLFFKIFFSCLVKD